MIKKLLLVLIIFFSHYCLADSSDVQVPKLLGYDTENTPVSLEPNKPALIALWASWCPYCKQAMPFLEHIQSEIGNRNIQVFFINTREEGSNREKKKRFMQLAKHFKKQGLKAQFVFDNKGKFYRAVGKPGIPTILLVDKNGNIKTQMVGFGKNSGKALFTATNTLLAAE